MCTISIIGSGGMAAAIGGRTAKAGYTVEVVSRDPAKARALANQLAAGATTGTYGAAPAGDIVILAVPYTIATAVVAEYGTQESEGAINRPVERARRDPTIWPFKTPVVRRRPLWHIDVSGSPNGIRTL